MATIKKTPTSEITSTLVFEERAKAEAVHEQLKAAQHEFRLYEVTGHDERQWYVLEKNSQLAIGRVYEECYADAVVCDLVGKNTRNVLTEETVVAALSKMTAEDRAALLAKFAQ